MNVNIYLTNTIFQSTLSHGERQKLEKSRFGRWHFNPLSRMEKDVVSNSCRGCNCLFQSTLSHGERLLLYDIVQRKGEFQSTLSHGERLDAVLQSVVLITISIHSLAWRKTLNSLCGIFCTLFQSTLSHGERLL